MSKRKNFKQEICYLSSINKIRGSNELCIIENQTVWQHPPSKLLKNASEA